MPMARVNRLVTLEQALASTGSDVKEWFAAYINPELASLLTLVGADRRYVAACGMTVADADGREYLDFLGGYGSLNLGHNHPELLAALASVSELPNILQASMNPVASALAASLAHISPGALQKNFLCNSGAEAVEAALKLARAATGREGLLSCEQSFHGKTFGALSVTGRTHYRAPFQPLVPGCDYVPFGDFRPLQDRLRTGRYAAFIVEPVQGEGGIIVPPAGYLWEAQQLCRDTGTLFVLDEVQTGLGRTGYLFAAEHDQLEPDVMALAKSLGGGLVPVGACLSTDDVWRKAYGRRDRSLLHTSTFGGNTRASAVALKTLEILLRDDLPAKAQRKGALFLQRLQGMAERLPLIKEVRGRGLMIGVEFHSPQAGPEWVRGYLGAAVCGLLLEEYQIISAFTFNNPNTIRFEPPLTVSDEQLQRAADALEDICASHRDFRGTATHLVRTLLRRKLHRTFRKSV
ncbi:MAG: aspartate aminotransferase family protein [Pseudomonadota bacterium]|nr:MAG: aspartate aminotransferase family protein [Pseudomonadota bacterium]